MVEVSIYWIIFVMSAWIWNVICCFHWKKEADFWKRMAIQNEELYMKAIVHQKDKS